MVDLLIDRDFYALRAKASLLIAAIYCTITLFFKIFTLTDSTFVVKKNGAHDVVSHNSYLMSLFVHSQTFSLTKLILAKSLNSHHSIIGSCH